MPTHWTYTEVSPDADLMQGDILVPTGELRGILQDVHPHFLDLKYIGFLVMTQSCDMARRDGVHCSTRYLNIAVVRQLADVLHDLLAHVCKPVASRVYLHESKVEANRLLQRLFNQNEQSLGLFYLHEDADAGIAVPSVALLRVGVTLRVQHYNVLVRSRRGRLDSEFTAKLGWLVGNLYSRIGTPDWSEPKERRRQLRSLVQDTLDADDSDLAPLWVRASWVEEASRKGIKLTMLSRSELQQELDKHKPPTAKKRLIQRATELFRELVPEVTDDQLKKVGNRLNNDPIFAQAMKSAKTE